ncbi:juvenile hormone esterase-like [Phymastichus coffea]|uniref:juvenile hormone esterase-like n=1 Tax=Phymastichus coffea TaxID=108790 RepID=UPI00273C93E3|nr:juvenile hormone esterase-like [Phymastichus coffea]
MSLRKRALNSFQNAQTSVWHSSLSTDTVNMEKLIVQTQNGQVRGGIRHSIEGYDYYSFLGIPYAKPPIGDLRFKDPEPVEDWTGIRDATKYGNMCWQFFASTQTYSGSNDCLYINVFAKSMKNIDKLKPVMVWVHGGGFMFGSGDDANFGPDYLLRKDIILVTFNYRLGIFGFLNLEDEAAPGNQGLKDQILAFKWVQANIAKFGGDPNNVTAFGESAGAICIQLLALSPMGKGLFNKMICQSGSIFNSWARLKNPKKYTFMLCNFLGKYYTDPKQIVQFLNTLDSEKIIRAQEQVRKSIEKMLGIWIYCPGIDSESPNPVVPVAPEKSILKGIQMPLLMGHNNREGLLLLMDPHSFAALKKEELIRIDRNFSKIINDRAVETLKGYGLTIKDLKQMYFGDKKISIDEIDAFVDLQGDFNFLESIHKLAKIQLENNTSPTYFYVFSYDKEISTTRAVSTLQLKGACHFDEVEFLFNMNLRQQLGFKPYKKGTDSYKVMEIMTELWTNFATYGTPTPAKSELIHILWEPLKDGMHLRYLNIDTNVKMDTMTNIEQKFLSAKSSLQKNTKL